MSLCPLTLLGHLGKPQRGGFGVTRGCPVPQVVFTVTLDVPHDAELGDALEVVANASR